MLRSLLTKELLRLICAVTVGLFIGVRYMQYRASHVDCSSCENVALQDVNTVENPMNTALEARAPAYLVLETKAKAYANVDEYTDFVTKKTVLRKPRKKSMQRRKSDELYVTTEHNGRLGNLMFQFAAAYGIARTVGKRVHTFSGNELLSVFPRLRERVYITAKSDDVLNRRAIIDSKHCAFVAANVDQARASANFSLVGYFQSWRYFDHVRDEVRQLFAFSDELLAEADRQIASIRDSFLYRNATKRNQSHVLIAPYDRLVYVAMHVRLGDITSANFAAYGYQVASGEYLRKTVAYFAAKYRTPRTPLLLVVFTEPSAVEWCRRELDESVLQIDYVTVVSNDRRELDMAMITRLNATVMSVGSFGWWAAYLARHETFYYGYPFRPNSDLSAQFTLDDYYPPDWHLFF